MQAGAVTEAVHRHCEEIQNGRPDVHVFSARRNLDTGFEPEGKAQDERHFGRLGVDVARVPFEASLAERFAVVGREDDQRVFAVSLGVQIGEQLP